jgi:hypothetical protein
MNEANRAAIERPSRSCYTLSASLVKMVLKERVCPKRLYHTRITNDTSEELTESLARGIFFEYKAFGTLPNNPSQQIVDLPRLQNGKKSADQVRIEMQADMLPLNFQKMKWDIAYTNFNTTIKLNDKFSIKVILDAVVNAYDEEHGEVTAIVDTKLTKDVNNKFGDSCWGSPEFMDHLSAVVYYWVFSLLLKEISEKHPNLKSDLPIKFYYYVADYKQDMECKIIEKVIHPNSIREMEHKLKSSMSLILSWEEQGFPAMPHSSLCSNCPLYSKCDEKETRLPVVRI